MSTYTVRPDGVVMQYDDYGVVCYIPPDPESPAYQAYLSWKQTGDEEAATSTILKQQVQDAMQSNRDQKDEDGHVIDSANVIINFSGTTLTQAQIISTLKQLAQGIVVLLQHDKSDKDQLNAIIRLVTGQLDATD